MGLFSLIRDVSGTIKEWRQVREQTGYWPIWSIFWELSGVPLLLFVLWILVIVDWDRSKWFGYVLFLVVFGIWAILGERVKRVERKQLLQRKRWVRSRH